MQTLDMTQDMARDPVTVGEVCEAILDGRVKAEVRDGYYEVKAMEIRGMRRSPDDLFATLERLRPRMSLDDLTLDACCFDEVRPGGEDIP
jgi:hypothetical protein